MANLKAAKKSIRADVRKRASNDKKRRAMKEAVKEVKDLVSEEKMQEAKDALPKAYQAIDKAAKKGIIKKNTASRKKSRLTKLVNKSTSA